MNNIKIRTLNNLEFVFDKEDTLFWVLKDWEAINDKLLASLLDKFCNDELIDFIDNEEVDLEYLEKYESWLEDFEYFTL